MSNSIIEIKIYSGTNSRLMEVEVELIWKIELWK